MSAAPGRPKAGHAPLGLRAAAPGLPAQGRTARREAGSDGFAACKASEVHAVSSVGVQVVPAPGRPKHARTAVRSTEVTQ